MSDRVWDELVIGSWAHISTHSKETQENSFVCSSFNKQGMQSFSRYSSRGWEFTSEPNRQKLLSGGFYFLCAKLDNEENKLQLTLKQYRG